MGCSGSSSIVEDNNIQEESNDSLIIENDQKIACQLFNDKIKILFLGSSDCGKSTILRQFRLLHGDKITDIERKSWIPTIRDNVVSSLLLLVNGCETFNISINDENVILAIERIKLIKNLDKDIPSYFSSDFILIYRSEAIQKVLESRCDTQLIDSADYFFDEVPRIMDSSYLPNDNDYLHMRLITTGISELNFTYHKNTFCLYDVGGQRGERRKWIRCFDMVAAIMFVASLSEYDQILLEDNCTNRMIESLHLFRGICPLPFFQKTAVILFLNKYDVFEKKIMSGNRDIIKFFPLFPGYKQDVHAALSFIRNMYKEEVILERTIYCHITTALDTNKFPYIWQDIQDIVFGKTLDRILL